MAQHLVEAKRAARRIAVAGLLEGRPSRTVALPTGAPLRSWRLLPKGRGSVFLASIWGMSFPWTLTARPCGASRDVLCRRFGISIETRAADVAHLGGALIVTVSVIWMGEVLRIGRYLNVLLGLLVATGPWLFGPSPIGYSLLNTALGVFVAALAIPRGPKTESYGARGSLCPLTCCRRRGVFVVCLNTSLRRSEGHSE